jgi:Fe-S-cluster containining protein
MELTRRIQLLEGLYAIHDRFTAGLDSLACGLHCDDCCTRNVTMTTLEGAYLLDDLPAAKRRRFVAAIRQQASQPRYRPAITTNTLARYCIEDREPPEENQPEALAPCPLLDAQTCPVYERRPFGCRCFVSRKRCGDQGYADVDDWVLTANTVFLQTIEQLDCPGCFGNFSDVLLALEDGKLGPGQDTAAACQDAGLLANQPTTALMIPPAHMEKIQPLLQAIRTLAAKSRRLKPGS